jgi:PHD/YefM family antitoxin component YafN of YafNO toxin-antitoxin module
MPSRFEEVIRKVINDYRVWIVANEGQPEIVVMPFDEYDRLRLLDRERWDERLNPVHQSIRASLADRKLPPLEEVIREMREERDQQLMRNIGLLPHDDTNSEG